MALPSRLHFPFVTYSDAHKDCVVEKVSALNNAADPVEAWRCAMSAVPDGALVELCPVTEVSYVVSSMFSFSVIVSNKFGWSEVMSVDECKQLLDTPLGPCCDCGRVMTDCRVFEWRMCYACLEHRASVATALVDRGVDFTRVKSSGIVHIACQSIAAAIVADYNQAAAAEGRPTLEEVRVAAYKKVKQRKRAVARASAQVKDFGVFIPEPICWTVLREGIRELLYVPDGICPALPHVDQAMLDFLSKFQSAPRREMHSRRSTQEQEACDTLRSMFSLQSRMRHSKKSLNWMIRIFSDAAFTYCNIVAFSVKDVQYAVCMWLDAVVCVDKLLRSGIEVQSLLMALNHDNIYDIEMFNQLELSIGRCSGTLAGVAIRDSLVGPSSDQIPESTKQRWMNMLSLSEKCPFKSVEFLQRVLAVDLKSNINYSSGWLSSIELGCIYRAYWDNKEARK